MKSCCVTGHRELPQGQLQEIRQRLEQEVRVAVQDGYKRFVSGFAEGTDQLFAEIVLEQKEHHPDLFLEAALPCPKRGSKRYQELLGKCNGIYYASEGYHGGVYLQRNRSMIQGIDRLIAVYDGRDSGGTVFSLRYAHALEKEIKLISITTNDK